MSQAVILTDLGYGDSGKGTITHFLADRLNAHTVVRTGGPQAMHNVVTANGGHFCFAQFGSGTLTGSRTHLSNHMVIEPYGILNEGRGLMEEHRLSDPFGLMTIDRRALVITPFQAIANRILELARGDKRHGTVGIGVGETVADSLYLGDEAIRAKDLAHPGLARKLEAIRQLKLRQLRSILKRADSLGPLAARDIATLNNPDVVAWAVAEFGNLADAVRVVDGDYLEEILAGNGTVVFEPSQGVLLDKWRGWHPYTTELVTTSEDALSLLAEHGYTGDVTRIGIIRAYQTRHGAGPFVTEDAWLTERIPDEHNSSSHAWQGTFRVGHLDLVALRYAIEACGGAEAFNALAVTCLDRIDDVGGIRIVEAYRYGRADADRYFHRTGGLVTGIKVRNNSRNWAHLSHQKRLGMALSACSPVIGETSWGLEEDGIASFKRTLSDRLGIPVGIMSYGPTEKDKFVTPDIDRRLGLWR